MSSYRRSAEGHFGGAHNGGGRASAEHHSPRVVRSGNGDAFVGSSGPPRSQRRKRKRPRAGKTHEWTPASATKVPRGEENARERIFQDVEGLLRRIREHAEETGLWSESHLSEITLTVTTFTRVLEDEGDPISDRARVEYQRVREKLSQALKGMEQEAVP